MDRGPHCHLWISRIVLCLMINLLRTSACPNQIYWIQHWLSRQLPGPKFTSAAVTDDTSRCQNTSRNNFGLIWPQSKNYHCSKTQHWESRNFNRPKHLNSRFYNHGSTSSSQSQLNALLTHRLQGINTTSSLRSTGRLETRLQWRRIFGSRNMSMTLLVA